jgi:hypothetical protein
MFARNMVWYSLKQVNTVSSVFTVAKLSVVSNPTSCKSFMRVFTWVVPHWAASNRKRSFCLNIVTCQPIVGLLNSGCDPLLRDSSVNRFPHRYDDVIPRVGKCHMLTWLLRDMQRWRHTAPGVGKYYVTPTFPLPSRCDLGLETLR